MHVIRELAEQSPDEVRVVKSVVIACLTLGIITFLCWFSYLVIEGYGEIMFWAILASVTIRPFQNSTYKFITYSLDVKDSNLVLTRNSALYKLFHGSEMREIAG
jgi:hypothetical protein